MLENVFSLPDGMECLRSTDKKILLYGMGNGAEKAYKLLTENGIEICGVFASDGFVRGHSFLGYQVLSISQAEEIYGDFIAVLCFALEGRKADILSRVTRKHKIFMPYTPVYGEGVTDKALMLSCKEDILKVYSLLADETSRDIYRRALSYCITGDIVYLKHREGDDIPPTGYFRSDGVYIDVGAYNGDTAQEYYENAPDVPGIICFEPDKRSFAKMLLREIPRLTGYNAAAGKCEGETTLSGKGGRNTATGKGNVVIPVKTVDGITNKKVACLKIDAEGDERPVLDGACKTILLDRPALNISLYHRVGDLWQLPLLIHDIDADYKLYIRKKEYVPLWDISLYCLP